VDKALEKENNIRAGNDKCITTGGIGDVIVKALRIG
jgi:hypothetical protein